jgi:hypothetical protein
MTLQDRCKQIRSKIGARNELRRSHKEAEALRERVGELQAARRAVSDAVRQLAVLTAKGVGVPKLPSPATTITLLLEVQRSITETPHERGKDFGNLKRSIDKVGRQLREKVEKAIESVKRDLPAVEEAFLKQVEVVPGYEARVASVRQQRDALLKGNDPNVSAEALEEFLDRREALRRLADELKPDEFPKDVLDFFRAARHSGAPLEKLTDTVRAWLSERDLLKNVRVTVVAR